MCSCKIKLIHVFNFNFSSVEAKDIFDCAASLGLTKNEYMWILSSSSLGTINTRQVSNSYPLGMLGTDTVNFNEVHIRMTYLH